MSLKRTTRSSNYIFIMCIEYVWDTDRASRQSNKDFLFILRQTAKQKKHYPSLTRHWPQIARNRFGDQVPFVAGKFDLLLFSFAENRFL